MLDSMQLTAKHQVATPVNWKPGDDVIIVPAVSDEDAKKYHDSLRRSFVCVWSRCQKCGRLGAALLTDRARSILRRAESGSAEVDLAALDDAFRSRYLLIGRVVQVSADTDDEGLRFGLQLKRMAQVIT